MDPRGSTTQPLGIVAPRRWYRTKRARAAFGVLIAVAAYLIAFEWSMPPDIDDPFDVPAALRIDVNVGDNAYDDFGVASRLLQPVSNFQTDSRRNPDEPKPGVTWSQQPAEVRAWVEANAEALAAFRAGSQRNAALFKPPDEMRINTLLPVDQDLRALARLAVWEGARRESQGDFETAWGWYRAVLRASRLEAQHGVVIQRLVSIALDKMAADAVARWSSNPQVNAALLRRALAEIQEIDATTPPNVRSLQYDYIILNKELRDPGPLLTEYISNQKNLPWVFYLAAGLYPKWVKLQVAVGFDAERSKRVLRLYCANWLAAAKLPKSRRPPLATIARRDGEVPPPPLFELDAASTPDRLRGISPPRIAGYYRGTILAQAAISSSWIVHYLATIDRERARHARLVVTLASEIFRRERGRAPTAPDELVPTYLPRIPDDYTTDDPDAIKKP